MKKGEVRIIDIIRVKELLVVGIEELCSKLGVALEKPRFRQ